MYEFGYKMNERWFDSNNLEHTCIWNTVISYGTEQACFFHYLNIIMI